MKTLLFPMKIFHMACWIIKLFITVGLIIHFWYTSRTKYPTTAVGCREELTDVPEKSYQFPSRNKNLKG